MPKIRKSRIQKFSMGIPQIFQSFGYIKLAHRILHSHFHHLHRPLLTAPAPTTSNSNAESTALYHAPFLVLFHNQHRIFTYANKLALETFDYPASSFIGLPSHLCLDSSQKDLNNQTKLREKYLKTSLEKGYAEDIHGIRVSATGRRFMISDTCVWNVLDEEGNVVGQAAKVPKWSFVDESRSERELSDVD